jgi:hypothetical protein
MPFRADLLEGGVCDRPRLRPVIPKELKEATILDLRVGHPRRQQHTWSGRKRTVV